MAREFSPFPTPALLRTPASGEKAEAVLPGDCDLALASAYCTARPVPRLRQPQYGGFCTEAGRRIRKRVQWAKERWLILSRGNVEK
jgi:hypothetical protein